MAPPRARPGPERLNTLPIPVRPDAETPELVSADAPAVVAPKDWNPAPVGRRPEMNDCEIGEATAVATRANKENILQNIFVNIVDAGDAMYK